MNQQMAGLRELAQSEKVEERFQTLDHMKKCVRAAADVVSSASTALGLTTRLRWRPPPTSATSSRPAPARP